MGSVANQSHQPKAILLLYKTTRELNFFQQKLNEHAPQADVYKVCIMPKDHNMMPLYEECCNLIETFNITVIINRPEIGSMIHAALAVKYSIPGPSFLATFLTLSKRYTREVIAAPLGLNVPFATILECSDSKSLIDCLKPLPCGEKVIAKPIFASDSLSLRVMANKDEVLSTDFLSSLTALKSDNRGLWYKGMISKFLENEQYNIDQGFLVELYAEKDPNVATFHGVDGLIYKKSFIPWCIRDQLYWHNRSECHIGSAFPSSLSCTMQHRVWDVMASIADKLIQYGFEHQFFEGELIVFKTGQIALMEINGRMPLTMTSKAYSDVLINGDPTKTLVAMAEDKVIEPPTLKPGMHGLFAYMSMLTKGKVSDIIDVEKVCMNDHVQLLKEEDEITDATNNIAGVNIGIVNCTGNSRIKCIKQAKDIITDITKMKESSPWFTDEYA